MRILRYARGLVLVALLALIPASSYAGVFISVGFAPPVLPVYVQPPCPEPGLMWTPGYWTYGPDGYYWVPGAWVPAPYVGALWTPPYWGWEGGLYVFHPGYWGPHVGYYGGVNYGFGYMGIGFVGGEWRGREFAYNTAVVNVNRTVIHNTYVNETIVHNTTIINNNRVAYSGGPGGIRHDPTPQERTAMHESHVSPTSFQQQHMEQARMDRASYFNANHGRPQNVALSRPLAAEQHSAPAGAALNAGAHPAKVHGNANAGATGRVDAPAQQPQYHPVPQAQPQYRPQPQPHTDYHAAPQPQYRPAPQPQPQYHPAPQQQYHPAPQARPEPQSRPAPQLREESRPAPEPREREPHR